MVISGSQPVLHFALNVAGDKETMNVTARSKLRRPTPLRRPRLLIARNRAHSRSRPH